MTDDDDKLKQLEVALANAQQITGNWYQCMIIQLAILKESNAPESARLYTKSN